MDPDAFIQLARWLKTTVSEEKLHLSLLPMPASGGRDIALFNQAYSFWKAHWFDRMQYTNDQGSPGSSLFRNELFLAADKIVLITTPCEIVAIGTLHYLDLENIAHCDSAALMPLGAEWKRRHQAEGVRTILYGTNLVSNPGSQVHGPSSILGRLYIVAMLRTFLESGTDMALCRMRRKTHMDKHGEFVGGRKEGEVHLPGMGVEQVEIMTATRDIAGAFPYSDLGIGFARFWDERRTAWGDVGCLTKQSHI